MIYKCENCGRALEYNPELRLLECKSCGSLFTVDQMSDEGQEKEEEYIGYTQTEKEENDEGVAEDEQNTASEIETMECKIYVCSSCGAELAVNGVEVATFCPYCGQPTIVFSRVSEQLKPSYIIPFRFMKDQVVNAIRERFTKGFFVPKEIREFEVERIRGIYIPYWIFDVYYHDKQTIEGYIGSGRNRTVLNYYREGETTFKGFTTDASKQFHDDTSEKLEPFDTRTMKPFDVAYMSGFYADKYDVNEEEARLTATKRIGLLYDEGIMENLMGNNLHVSASKPEIRFERSAYAMLPVWFLTFRYKDEPYTILVNGQTGKIVGSVPMDKKKFFFTYLGISTALTIILTPIFYFIHQYLHETYENANHLGVVIFLAIMGISVFFMGFGYFWSMYKNIKQTRASAMNRFVKNRQEVM